MGDNRLLKALEAVKRVEPRLKEGKRDQLNRAELISVNSYLKVAIDSITSMGLIIAYASDKLLSLSVAITDLLNEPEFVETTEEFKEIMIRDYKESIPYLYEGVAKYYMDHDFDDTDAAMKSIQNVIEECIDKGYYYFEEE